MQHAVANGLMKPPIGEINGLSFLTNEQVLEIVNSKESNTDIGKLFGMCRRSISNIRLGISWGHLTGIKYIKKERVFTNDMVIEIYTSNEIADVFVSKYNIPRSYISQIRTGKIYSSITSKLPKRVKVNGKLSVFIG